MAITETQISHFQDGYHWEGVEHEVYKSGQEEGKEWKNIVRQVLVGKRDEATAFHVRYFEITPGGHSSLEKHGHAHVVIAVRGQGKAVLGTTGHDMKPFDTVYVAPWTPHQFLATRDTIFGFFCIVDAERDRPQPVSHQEKVSALAAGAVIES